MTAARNRGAPTSAPPAGGVIGRPELERAVEQTPAGGACVITAPAGFGRHTLVEAVTGPGAPVARLGDEPSLGPLVDACAAAGGGWLVVEVPDLIAAPAVRDELAAALRSSPPQCRLAVISGTALGSVVAEARLAGRLVEIDQHDLELGPEQSRELLLTLCPGLDSETVTDVVALCGGWVGALRLTGQRAARRPGEDVTAWLRTRGAELLLGGWLDGLDERTRDMLVATAFLTVLHPDLVDAVLPGTGAGIALLTLAREPGPVRPARVPTHQGKIGYERHPLLTELVRHLALAQPPEPQLHLRAAAWLRSHGDITGELENLFAAGRTAEAASRLFAYEDELLAGGNATSALRWYDAVGDAEPGDLVLMLRQAWGSALSGDTVRAGAMVGGLVKAMGAARESELASNTAFMSLEGEIHVLTAWLAHQAGDLHTVVASAGRATALFGSDLSLNSHQIAPLYLARALTVLGRLEEAEEPLVPLRSHAFALAAISEGTRAEVEAELAWAAGRVHECRSWAARRTQWAGPADDVLPGHRPPVAKWLAVAESGEPETAAHALKDLVSRTNAAPVRSVTDEVVVRLALAEVLTDSGRFGRALAVLRETRAIVDDRAPSGGLLQPVGVAEVRARLLAGDPVRAERTLRGLERTAQTFALRARLGVLRRTPVARQMVREVEPTSPRLQVELAILAAWADLEVSRQRAERHLLRAADIAAAHGIRTALVGAPSALLDVARRAATHHVHDALLGLADRADLARGHDPSRPAASVGPAGPALSRGELQLVGYLPTRMTNADIAAELGVSVNTVKTRLRRLFAKLGVHDRKHAVNRAEELGLLRSG